VQKLGSDLDEKIMLADMDPKNQSHERQMQMSLLKNKNLNRQKILLSPGAGNLRG